MSSETENALRIIENELKNNSQQIRVIGIIIFLIIAKIFHLDI